MYIYIYTYIHIYIYSASASGPVSGHSPCGLVRGWPLHDIVVRTQGKACSSDSRFRRKLSGTTGHRLYGTQRPQILFVAAWVVSCSLQSAWILLPSHQCCITVYGNKGGSRGWGAVYRAIV